MKKSKTNSKLSNPAALKKLVQHIIDKNKFKKRINSIGCGDDEIMPS